MSFLETKGLGLVLDGKTILDDINLKIERGEFLVLIGPTGAGKTSLLRLLDLLEKPTSGSLMLEGKTTGASAKERLTLRRRMAFVQQKPVAFNQSVFDNVALGLRWRSLPSAEITKRVNEALLLVGLKDKSAQSAKTLSGGETQRVAIARALVTRPEVLFLDEPTANLDPVSTAKIEEVLARISREAIITVVMATHDMSQGQRLAHRVAVLMEGLLRQTGSPQEIFSRPVSHEVATFVGVENIWPGVVTAHLENLVEVQVGPHVIQAVGDFVVGEKVDLFIRPEEITISLCRDVTSARNVLRGEITRLSPVGALARVEIFAGFPVMVLVTRKSAEDMELAVGKFAFMSFKATAINANRHI